MARLNMPPTASAAIGDSPPPSSSHGPDLSYAASDDEAAQQQLAAEARSSDAHPPPPPAALLGANLLNEARIDQRHGSQASGMVRKYGAGKLKRVSIMSEGPKQNLARRGDVYDIELSPEKGHYALPEKVNQKPLKIRKKKPVGEERSVAPALSSDLPTHHVDRPHVDQSGLVEHVPSTDPGIRSSPPQTAPAESDAINVAGAGDETSVIEAGSHPSAPEDVEVEETLDGGKPRCTVVSYKYDKKAGGRYQQCRRPAAGHADDRATCSIHMNRPPAVQCGEMLISEDVTSQCYRIAITHTANGARCASHAESQQPTRGKRKTESHHDGGEPSSSRHHKVSPENSEERRRPRTSAPVQAPTRTLTKRRKTAGDAPTEPSQQLSTRTRNSQGRPEKESIAALPDLSADEGSEYEQESDEGEGSDAQDREARRMAEFPEDLDKAFKFLELEERPEACKTRFGAAIQRLCDTCRAHFDDKTISMDTVVEEATEVRETLELLTSKVLEKHQRAFKSDAYGYLFRSLTQYLRALYVWLHNTHDTVIESLEAMRIVAPLIHEILTFKDRIAQWNVIVPQSHKGDRLIKDVDSKLIAPLRDVSKSFSVRLSKLEEAQKRLDEQAEIERKAKEWREAEIARIEAIESTQARKKRWQNLHIVRMQCEPDVYKRRRLFHTSFEDEVERDANGVVFERLPIFKPRSTPPHSQMSEAADEVEWTEDEETALLEGLQEFAGPRVFEKIFKTYCDPRSNHPRSGELRSRSVAEIVSKARWMRSSMIVLRQSSGKPVDEWVTKIPVLP